MAMIGLMCAFMRPSEAQVLALFACIFLGIAFGALRLQEGLCSLSGQLGELF